MACHLRERMKSSFEGPSVFWKTKESVPCSKEIHRRKMVLNFSRKDSK